MLKTTIDGIEFELESGQAVIQCPNCEFLMQVDMDDDEYQCPDCMKVCDSEMTLEMRAFYLGE